MKENFLVIEFNYKNLLILISIFAIVIGYLRAERIWDEEGSKIYHQAKKDAGGDGKGEKSKEVSVSEEKLKKVSPRPFLIIVGWVLLGVSFVLDPKGGLSDSASHPIRQICILNCCCIAYLTSVSIPATVRARDMEANTRLNALMMLNWASLAMYAGWNDKLAYRNSYLSHLFGMLTVVCVGVSSRILWTHRKMGASWDKEGRPNSNPKVYSPSLPILVLGWFFFFLSLIKKI